MANRRRWTLKAMGLLVGLGLTLGPMAVPAAAQEGVDARLERIRAQLPSTAMERIEIQLQQAMERGLPVEPILDKALEGMAKRVPADRIAGAVVQLTTQLGQARDLLGEGAPPAATDITAVADAIRRGVPEQAVRRIAGGAAGGEPLAMAVHTVGDLLDQGVPVEEALAAVEAWRAGGGEARQLRELPAAVERLIRQGTLPAHAAAAVTRAMGGAAPGMPGQRPGGQPGAGPPDGPPIPPGAGPPDERGKGTGKPPGGGPPGGG